MTGVAAPAGILCAYLLLIGDVRADPSRFLPWKEPTAPSVALNDLAGRPHTLADYRGSVVLVNFWATWCEPCRDEMASMQALQQRLAGRPFVILLVNHGESRARVGEFVKRESIQFPILLDPNQEAPRAWRVRVLPSSFLVAPDGRVRYSVIGEIDWAGVEAVNLVQGLLREGRPDRGAYGPIGFAEATRPGGVPRAGSAGRPGDAASAPRESRLP